MCDPTGGFLTAAAVGLQMFSQISQAQSAAATDKANARNARTNADIQNNMAHDATQRGADNAALAREKGKMATASLRAKAGSSGLLADTGTNLDLQEQNAGVAEENALTIGNNAEREAYGYKVGAMNSTNQANMFSTQAKSDMTNGLLSAGATLVTGAANFGNSGGFSGGGSTEISPFKQYGPFNNSLPWRNAPMGA